MPSPGIWCSCIASIPQGWLTAQRESIDKWWGPSQETVGSISKLLHRSRLPSLRECLQQLRLLLFYRVVEGSMPTLPPEHFLIPQQPGRLVRAWKQADVNTTNVMDNYVRNNDRCFRVPLCHTAQYQNSFIPGSMMEWNRLDSNTGYVDWVASFRLLSTLNWQCWTSLSFILLLLWFLILSISGPFTPVCWFLSNAMIQIQFRVHSVSKRVYVMSWSIMFGIWFLI